jgi:D-aminoacyl-tRNA deacylase
MRAVIQRVTRAQITCSSGKQAEIDRGYVIMLGVGREDDSADIEYMLKKIPNLRLFPDSTGVKNLSILEMNSARAGNYSTGAADKTGEILLVSNFTLHADTKRGRRPHYGRAADPEKSLPLYEELVKRLQEVHIDVKTGVFGDMMQIDMQADGPVTIVLDSKLPEY